MILLQSPDVICSGKQLAEVIGVTSRQIERLAVDGVLKPVRCKLRGKHFRLASAMQAFLAYQKRYVTEQVSSSNGEYEKARTRKAQAAAAMMELELAIKRGEYLYKPDIEFHLGMLLRNCRDRILSIPSRLGHVLRGKTTFREVHDPIEAEVRLALNEIADKKCFDWDRIRRESRAYLRAQGMPDDDIESMLDEQARRRKSATDGQEPTEP
jgi:phage terminase Nu1 subunit (DNA packaging protein)